MAKHGTGNDTEIGKETTNEEAHGWYTRLRKFGPFLPCAPFLTAARPSLAQGKGPLRDNPAYTRGGIRGRDRGWEGRPFNGWLPETAPV